MEQKLAYPIDKHQKGTYWLTYFEIDGVEMPKIDRALALCEPVLRQMTIRLDPRMVEPVLANARGESVRVSSHAETAGPADEEEEVEIEEKL
jgi:small subunit ribosomal protein S6